MKNIFRSFTFFAVLGFFALLILQWLPITGIFLMFMGAAFFQGLLANAVLIALIIDVAFSRFPPFLLLAPIAAYGGYYTMYYHQVHEIARREAELKAINPGMLLKFDPATQDLVSNYAGGVVNNFKIPVAYMQAPSEKPEGFLAYRPMTRATCEGIEKDSLSRINTTWFDTKRMPDANKRDGQMICDLQMPEVPHKAIVKVDVKSAEIWKHKAGVSEDIYTLSFDGNALGEYRKAYAYQYTPLPIPLIGCFLNDGNASWDCMAEFTKIFRTLDTTPNKPEAKYANGDPIGIMLGLEPWNFDELQNFKDWDFNKQALVRIAGESQRVDENSFATLDKLIADPKAEVPWRMAYSLSTNPTLAAQNVQKMVELFKILSGSRKQDYYYAGKEKLENISAALAALPAKDIAPHLDELIAAIGDSRLLDFGMVFYVRMADFTDHFMEQYINDLVKEKTWVKLAPGYAICRIGKADDTLKKILKEKFHDPENMKDKDMSQSLFLALIGVGEASFAEIEINAQRPRNAQWFSKVLEDFRSKGGRPNNCMPRDWPAVEYVGPEMAGWVR